MMLTNSVPLYVWYTCYLMVFCLSSRTCLAILVFAALCAFGFPLYNGHSHLWDWELLLFYHLLAQVWGQRDAIFCLSVSDDCRVKKKVKPSCTPSYVLVYLYPYMFALLSNVPFSGTGYLVQSRKKEMCYWLMVNSNFIGVGFFFLPFIFCWPNIHG